MFYGQPKDDNVSKAVTDINKKLVKPVKKPKGKQIIKEPLTNAVPTIKEMKDIIINAIDIDKFITYQNGDLITSFANPKLETEKQVNVNNIKYIQHFSTHLVDNFKWRTIYLTIRIPCDMYFLL